jgi:putative endonuclease
MSFFVYIAHNNKHDKFYIGQTNDLDTKIWQHNNKLSVFTSKFDGEWIIVYTEDYPTRSEALKRERFLKNQKSKVFYRKLSNMRD